MNYISNYCESLNTDLFIQQVLNGIKSIKKEEDILTFKNLIFNSNRLNLSFFSNNYKYQIKENLLHILIKKITKIFMDYSKSNFNNIYLELIELFIPFSKYDIKILDLIISNERMHDKLKYDILLIFQKYKWLKDIDLFCFIKITSNYSEYLTKIYELLIGEIFNIKNLKLFRDKEDKNILLYFFESITNPYQVEIFDTDWIERKRNYHFFVYISIVNFLINFGIPLHHVDRNGNNIFHYLFLCNEEYLNWNHLKCLVLSNAIGKDELKKLIIENLVVEKYKFYKNREGKYPLDYASSYDYFNIFNKAIKDKNSNLMEEIFRSVDNNKLKILFDDFLKFNQGDMIIMKIKNYINYINFRNCLIFNKIEKKVIPKVPKDVYFSIVAKMLFPEIPK